MRNDVVLAPGSVVLSTRAIDLPFSADACMVVNTSGYTLLMRRGSRSIPTSNADTDIQRVPPGMMMTFPVDGTLYGVSLTSPATLATPAGNDAICVITFLKDELIPSFGAVPLLGTDAPEQVLVNHVSGGGSPYTTSFPVSGALKEITFFQGAGNNITSVVFTGHTTGYIYGSIPGGYLAGQNVRARLPVFASLDTQIDMSVSSGGTNPFVIVGHYGSADRGLWAGSGAQIVVAQPQDGNFAIPTTLIDGSGSIQGNGSNPLFISSRPNRAPRVLLNTSAFVGAGTIYHGPFDMQGAIGGTFVVYVSVGVVNVNVSVTPDTSFFEMATFGPQGCPAFLSFDFGPGATGAGGVTIRQPVALKGQEHVYINRSGSCTYSITFWPSMFA